MRILVGDDDHVNQLVIRGFLKKLGYECSIVGTGQEVIDKVAEEAIDLLFLDVQLPDIDGFDVARALKNREGLPQMPRITFVSGHDASDFRQELEELGNCQFLTKPVSVDRLREAIG